MGKTHKIYNWGEWVSLCADYSIDPYENADFGIDMGGGDSEDFEYKGIVPKREGE